jgi:hypothetical protein
LDDRILSGFLKIVGLYLSTVAVVVTEEAKEDKTNRKSGQFKRRREKRSRNDKREKQRVIKIHKFEWLGDNRQFWW